MRILYHHRTQAEDAQGVHIHEIIKAFKALGHEVREVALVPAEHGPHTSARGKQKGGGWSHVARWVPAFVFELMEIAYDRVARRRLDAVVRDFRPDFVYERYALYTACGVQVARRHGVPLILEVNGPVAFEREQAGRLAFPQRARRSERWILSNATRTLVVSTPMKEMFVAAGVPADRMQVVPNGVDPEHFHGRDTGGAVRGRYGLEGKRVLGFVGWIRPWHGLVELTESMSVWADRDVHLLIVGDGPARPAIERAAAAAGVADRVHVTGAVERRAVPDHIAAFDVALQPAAPAYASPMKVFEYLAMAKPVVACRQPNLCEILTDGDNAVFFEPGRFDELARVALELLGDPARLQRMGQRARQSVFERGFLWTENAERAVELARAASA